MSLPSFRIPIVCTDSCRQMTCTCCSSNVSVNNWEKRIVRYNEADNELQDAPHPGLLARFFASLCCSGKIEQQKEQNAQTCRAIHVFLAGNYQVDLTEAANDSRICIAPYQRGEKFIKMRDFQSLKRSAEEICKRRSGESNASGSNHSVPAENFKPPHSGGKKSRSEGTSDLSHMIEI